MKTIKNKSILLGILFLVCLNTMADITPNGGYVEKSWTGTVSGAPIYERVTVTEFGHLTIEGKAISATGGAQIAITGISIYSEVNNAATLRTFNNAITQVHPNKTLYAYGLAPGVYYIKVEAGMSYVGANSTGTFSAGTTFTPEVYTSECVEPENDSVKSAVRLPENVTMKGTIGFEVKNGNTALKRDELDYFRILLKNDSKVRFKLNREGLNNFKDVIRFEVYYLNNDSNTNTLNGKTCNLSVGSVTNKLDTIINLPRGYYILKVNLGYSIYCDGYDINYSIDKAFPDAGEPNDTYDKAKVLSEKEQGKGTIGIYQGDFNDYYSFTLKDYADVKINFTMDEWLKGTPPTYNSMYFWLYGFPDKLNPKPADLNNYIVPLATGPYDSNDNFVYPNTITTTYYGPIGYKCDQYYLTPQKLPADGLVYKRLSPGTYYFKINDGIYNHFGYSYNISWEKTKTYDFGTTLQSEPYNFEYTAYPEITPNDTVEGMLGLLTMNDRERYSSSITVNKNMEDIFRYRHEKAGNLSVKVKTQAFRDENLRKNIPVDYHYGVKLYRKKATITEENCHKTSDFTLFQTLEVKSENSDTTVIFKDIPADLFYLKIEYFKLNDYDNSQVINSYDGYSTYKMSVNPIPYFAGFEVAQFNNSVKIINTSNARNFSWEFGDGSTSNLQFPEHFYNKYGDFTIKQKVMIGNEEVLNSQQTISIKGVFDCFPKSIPTIGKFTMSIYGNTLTEKAIVKLYNGSTTISPVKIEKVNAGIINAIFDVLSPLAEGAYSLSATMPGVTPIIMENIVQCVELKLPFVTGDIDGASILRVRTPSQYYLVLHNTSNVDANGVNAYVYIPDFMDVEMKVKNFASLIDPNGNFTFNCPPYDKTYSIPNSEILSLMSNFKADISPDKVANKPFSGRVLHIYVPKLAASEMKKIPFIMTSKQGAATQNFDMAVYVEQDNMYDYTFGTFTNYMNLNHLVDLFLASGDAATQNPPLSNNALWQRTFEAVANISMKAINADGTYQGYLVDKIDKETGQTAVYDGTIIDKQIATVILALKRLSADFAFDKTTNGIADLTNYDISKFAERLNNYRAHTLSLAEMDPNAGYKKVYANAYLNDSSRINRLQNYVDAFTPMQAKSSRSAVKAEEKADFSKFDPDKIKKVELGAPWFSKLMEDFANWLEKIVGGPEKNKGRSLEELKFHPQTNTERIYNGFTEKSTLLWESKDPNEKNGPTGFTDKRYISNKEQMNYEIKFENMASADLPALIVNVKDTLDINKFDLSAFELKNISIGDTIFNIPNGLSQYIFDYDMRPAKNLIVSISAKLDKSTGIVYWSFVGIDPVTKKLPDDTSVGFLPPNKTAPEGEGSVSFSVKLKEGLPNETAVNNKASIVFDYNDPIITNLWTNTIDNMVPVSSGMQSNQTNDSTLTVSWNSTDANSKVKFHRMYASVNNSEFFPMGIYDGNQAQFYGQMDNIYSFYVEAVDSVGNSEIKQPAAETTIKMVKTGVPTKYTDIPFILQLSPNPAVSYFTIQGLEKETAVSVFDISGKKVMEKIVTPNEKISVTHLSKGVYLVKVNGKTGKLMVK